MRIVIIIHTTKNLTNGCQVGILVYVRVREGSKIMYLLLHIPLQLPASKGLQVRYGLDVTF